MTRNDFVKAAQTYLGTPYLHQGRNRNGLDCIGLVVCAAHDASLLTDQEFDQIPRDYLPDPDGARLPLLLHQHAERIHDPAEAQAGDLIMIRYTEEPQHLVIVERPTEWGPMILHAVRSYGVCQTLLNHIWLDQLNAKIHAAFKMRRITD